MCGIAGVVDLEGRTAPDELARRTAAMCDTLRHRGPDDDGTWVGDGVALGQRRLAIVDLSPTGHQPMASADGSVVVTYNGEIYNHRALRTELEALGVGFRGTSDTEVLVEAMARFGVDAALDRLNGMFAIAAFEPGARRLWLVRDRLGEKPLYWAVARGQLVFGSELRALRADPVVDADLDDGAVASFLRFGYVPAPRTILRGVSKLEAGSLLRLELSDGVPAIRRWWSLEPVVREPPRAIGLRDAADEVADLLGESVRLRMQADVPVGVFLSAGLDSSTVAALARAGHDEVRTYCVGFGDTDDETASAAAIARHLGTTHTTLHVPFGDALDLVERLPDLYDEPFADPSQVPVALVAAAAREHVTVALTGDGGDEVFGGYNRYVLSQRADRVTSRLPRSIVRVGAGAIDRVPVRVLDAGGRAVRVPQIGTKVHKLAGLLRADGAAARFGALVDIWPPDGAGVPTVADPARWPTVRGDIEQLMYVDTLLTLPEQMLTKVDRGTMSASLEARAPFLDHRLVELAWRLPLALRVGPRSGKVVVREVAERHIPAALLDRPKTGFDPPIASWLRGPLRAWATDLLAAGRVGSSPAVQRAWQDHQRGRRNHDYRLWTVLMFEAWCARWGHSS